MKIKVVYGLLITCLVLVSGILYINHSDTAVITMDIHEEGTEGGVEISAEVPMIIVYVTGAVHKPEVYEVEEHSRLYEVIELAGGFLETASKDSLNLARFVFDGEMIQVPDASETSKVSGVLDLGTARVSINQASEEELMSLTGIGSAKAQAIIEYRKANGPFQRIEDLMKVTGIKEAMFNKIKDDIVI